MFKHASPAVLACVAVPAAIAVVVVVFLLSPTRPKEGLSKVDALGKGARPNERRSDPEFMPTLKVWYVVRGVPGETYTVELWLGRTDFPELKPFHFDTQEVTIPTGQATGFVEVSGMFDRRVHDRDRPPGQHLRSEDYKPGQWSLLAPLPSWSWDCRLVVKRRGKVLSDTDYFRVPAPPIQD
jgi:hypothetical protein